MKKRKCSKTTRLILVILILTSLSCVCSSTGGGGGIDWKGIGCSIRCAHEKDPAVNAMCIQSCMRK